MSLDSNFNIPQVMVYDSSFSFVDQDTQKLLKQLLGTKIDIRVGGRGVLIVDYFPL